ncbi:Uncharacterized protein Rs2_26089 [Raphanus sativus]|nr:Uncharacterized protein Rs2_26089 [Raphanus sativus]
MSSSSGSFKHVLLSPSGRPCDQVQQVLVRRFDHLQVLANTNLELPDVVGEIRSVQGSDLQNVAATGRIVILIRPFRLEAVVDNQDSVTFIVFDREITKLIKKEVASLALEEELSGSEYVFSYVSLPKISHPTTAPSPSLPSVTSSSLASHAEVLGDLRLSLNCFKLTHMFQCFVGWQQHSYGRGYPIWTSNIICSSTIDGAKLALGVDEENHSSICRKRENQTPT